MKITPADQAFSFCVRERNQWMCERCGKQYERGSGLHCAHFQGRAAWGTRFCPENCFAFCFGCHQLMDGQKGTFAEFFKERRGSDIYDLVIEKSQNIQYAKIIRRTKGVGEIAAFYREQYNDMLRKRAGGLDGWMDFEEWA